MPSPAQLLRRIRDKRVHTWLPSYARHQVRLAARGPSPRHTHVLFALCDHFEPEWGDPSADVATARVDAWHQRYPALADGYRDSTGRRPRHSFFFPGEQYKPHYLERLAELTKAGYGEVELHLHHDNDTAANLEADVLRYLDEFAQHGHLSRDPNGRLRFAFIHGNWCLANARRDGRWCGVDNEVELLWRLGCYVDYTFPAAPNESQPPIVNQVYWPTGNLSRRRAADQGVVARVGHSMDDRILIIEGPLAPARRPDRLAIRIENGDIHGTDPGDATRVRSWINQRIGVEGRPEWIFVKVHTHGCPDKNLESLLGDGGHSLHSALADYNDRDRWSLHYVTAREMYNVAIAAMDGKHGNPADFFDYKRPPPPIAT